MQDNEVLGASMASRRRLLRACAVTIGAGLIGARAMRSAYADLGDAGGDGAPPPPGSKTVQGLATADLGTTSYNGWTVGTPGSVIGVQSYTIPGTSISMQVRSGDVATVLIYVAQRFNAEVETLIKGQCGGYDYRPNVNNPSVWSNHASGTAIDLNWAVHPNGSPNTFTPEETAAVRNILASCGSVVYWGQDYRGTVDGMHFEINVPPGDPRLTALVQKIGGTTPPPAPVFRTGVDSFLDGSGARHIFGTTKAGQLQELTRPPGGSWQKRDASAGGYVIGAPAAIYADGRCEIFAIGGDNTAWTQARVDGGSWSGWKPMGGSNLVGGLRAVVGPDGNRHVFGVTSGGHLLQFIGSRETAWALQDVSNGGLLRGTPAVTYLDGRYDVFGIGFDGAIWQQTYVTGSPAWNAWRRVGGSDLVGGLDAITDGAAGLRVLGIDSANRVQQATSASGSWVVADISNGGQVMGTPTVLLTNSRAEVMAIGLDGQVWLERSSSSGWTAWSVVGGDFGG